MTAKRLLYSLLMFLSAVGYVHCQPSTTAISGTLYFPFTSTPAAGCTITVTGPNATTTMTDDMGNVLTPGKSSVLIPSNGFYSFGLVPNDKITPAGTTYTAWFNCANGSLSHNETWLVPTSGTPLNIGNIRVTTTPQVQYKIGISQLDTKALGNGIYCITVANGAPSLTTCPINTGGGTALSWSALTSATWSAVSPSTWSGLAQ